MRKSDKIAVHKVFETVDRNIEKLRPEEKKVSISAGGLIQGKRFRWKFKPLPILEVAEKTMGYTFLSDNQKRVLIELFGDDPEIFPTDWNQAILRIGQRGGKNTVVEVMVNYICQILISVENVYEYLGYFTEKTIPVTQDIEITNNSMVGECVPLDSEILTLNGWKKYSEVSKGDIILTYNCEKDKTEWGILEKISTYKNKPLIELYNRKYSIKCTPDHKWAVQKTLYKNQSKGVISLRHPHGLPRGPYKNRKPDRFLCKSNELINPHKIIVAAKNEQRLNINITPEECAIIGWTITDGTIQRKGYFRRICVYQSKKKHLKKIRKLFKSVDKDYYECITKPRSMGIRNKDGNEKYSKLDSHSFYLTADISRSILRKAGINDGIENIIRFVMELDYECREAMLQAMMDAEGDEKGGFAQKKRLILEAFQILATLNGYALGKEQLINNKYGGCYVQNLRKTKYKVVAFLKKRRVENQDVWCPTTKNGTWIMRQNGFITITGNSQAKDVFFNRMKMIFKTSVIPGTNDKIYPRFSGLRVGETGEKDIKSKVITFPKFFKDSGALKLYSLDSGITTFEGKNILLSLVDEPSRAHTQATYLNAKLLWEGLTSNVNNTYPNMVGKTLAFSYLNNSEYDLTNELAEQELSRRERAKEKGEERKPYRKVFTYSTFEFNPSTKKTDLMIKEKYEDNIDDARARFECIKSRTQFAFMNPYVNKVKECIIPGLQNRVEYGSKIITKKYKTGKIEKLTAIEIFQVKPDERFRIWASDTSINKDRFILGSGYVEDFERSYTPDISINLANYKVICDLILKWEPTKEHPVDYENVQKVFDHMLDMYSPIV
jgi:hypothetical protein